MTEPTQHGTTTDGRRQTRLVIYRGASDVAAKGVMFVVTVVAARWLPRPEFALVALATTLGWLGAVAGDFGVQVHLARAVAQHPSAVSSLLAQWLPVRVLTGLIALACATVAILWLEPDRSAFAPMLVFCAAYAATGVGDCVYYVFRALDRSDLESTLTLVSRGLLLLLAPVAMWVHPTALSMAFAMLAPAVGASVAAMVIARRLSGHADAAWLWPTAATRRTFATSVGPIGLGALLSALYFRVDIFLLDHWGGASQVAMYNAVFRLVDALRLFPAAVLAVALPRLFTARSLDAVTRVGGPLTAAAIGASTVLWFVAPSLVPAVYGAGFADGVAPFRVLLVALPLMSLNAALTHQLIGWHGHRTYAALCAAALVSNLLLNWSLIPRFGATGSAWSTVWTEVVLCVGCVIALARAQRIHAVSLAGELPALEVRS